MPRPRKGSILNETHLTAEVETFFSNIGRGSDIVLEVTRSLNTVQFTLTSMFKIGFKTDIETIALGIEKLFNENEILYLSDKTFSTVRIEDLKVFDNEEFSYTTVPLVIDQTGFLINMADTVVRHLLEGPRPVSSISGTYTYILSGTAE